ncbi:MAG: hypothetical protein U0R80_19145 [Nocardioidaceae bacterium]
MRAARVVRCLGAVLLAVALTAGTAWGPSQAEPGGRPGGVGARCSPYVFTDLGVLGGLDSRAHALGPTGVVAGLADTAPGSGSRAFHAFRWTPEHPGSPVGSMEDLGALGADERSSATGVDRRGIAVGVSLPNDGGSKAFVAGSAMHQLPGLGGSAEAAAVDDHGRVVGHATAGDGFGHAVMWLPRRSPSASWRAGRASYRVVDLGVPDGWVSSSADAVNDRGLVAGSLGDADYYGFAAVWTPDRPGGTHGTWTELGVLPGGDGSVARDVNRSGVVVGQSTSAVGDRAFVWDGRGAMRALPPLRGGTESFAFAVDDRGLVVGYADGADTDGDRAVVWWRGRAYDLNRVLPAWAREAGYVLMGAYDVNGRGQVVGVASVGGHAHGFLLTPRRGLGVRTCHW